ncbi:GIY-YIG nuclease family protein [Rhizobium aethiopicum]|uniref:Bacteriophage T5 Orf172 DNA-binding domain-containing protein n=1 Tax=Rhizobium aethiopicum TaxID=1138170 RepID=A0A7W6MI15_9HYPH|nr:GIY-YIG nuclease family protein [Rhizobium aethiopicum]MBB4192774.1 hypothetical protein [Rhizobium aethiopicum]
MQPPKEPILTVHIVSADLVNDNGESNLILVADDAGQILRMQITVESANMDTQERGQSALWYLLGELGIHDPPDADAIVSKRLPRWAWDKVASIASPKQLAAPPKPHVSPRGDKIEFGRFVYVISAQDTNPPLCKIGIANSPEKRLAQLSTGSPHALRLELTRFANNARAVERSAHSYFSGARQNGEWFAISADKAITYIIEATRSAA